MKLQDFKKKFKDVAVQKLQTKQVLSRAAIQDVVTGFIDGFGTGLVFYEYYGKDITIYTSEIFKNNLMTLEKGSQVLDENTGKVGTVVSDKPYIMCGELCVRVDFGGDIDAFSCKYFM